MKNAVFFSLVLLLVACTKNVELLNSDHSSTEIDFRSPTPSVWDGMLSFDDLEEATDYYKYLDTLITGVDNIDSTLDIVESNYAYTSFRSTCILDDFNERDYESLAEKDWIGDVVRTSIMNENNEFKVGDYVVITYSTNLEFYIHKDSTDLINAFRITKKGGRVDSIPWGIIHPSVGLLSGITNLKWSEGSEPDPPVIELDWRSPELVITNEGPVCNKLHQIITARLKNPTVITTYESATFKVIDFGDGTDDLDPLYSTKAQWVHVYPDFGEYKVTVAATYVYVDENLDEHTIQYEDDYSFIISEGCNFSSHEFEPPAVDDGDNLRMEYKDWIRSDLFGTHVGGRTTSYHKKNNGNWAKHKCDEIHVDIDGLFRFHNYMNDDCEFEEYMDIEEYKTGARDARASKQIANRCVGIQEGFFSAIFASNPECAVILSGDAFSNHYARRGSSDLEEVVEIITCPE